MRSTELERAAYISDLALELAELARSDHYDLLSYILRMASMEAERVISAAQSEPSNGESEASQDF